MAGSPQTDPRLEPLADDLMSVYGWTQGAPIEHAANMLAIIDAADEASGVRRVTAHELADNLELARQEERQRVIRAMLAAHPVERRQSGNKTHGGPAEYSAWCTKCRGFLRFGGCHVRNALSAADAPVGGVS